MLKSDDDVRILALQCISLHKMKTLFVCVLYIEIGKLLLE